MAITIGNIYPAQVTYYPGYNDMVLTATSTNTAQPNFKYVVDIYINGTQVFRQKLSPDANGRLTSNVHRIIENYLTYDINVADAAFVQCPGSIVLVALKVGEEYGTPPSVYANLATISTYAINTCLAWDERLDWVDTTYILSGSGSKFLTSQSSFSIQPSQNAWLHLLRDTTHKPEKMEIKTYDYLGNLLGQYRISNAYATVSATADRLLRFPTGTANLNLISGGITTVVSGSTPIITGFVASYTIQALDNSNNPVSALVTYTVNSANCLYTNFRLHFLNKYGGFDAMNFALASHETINQINRKTYKQVYGSNNGGVWGYSKSDLNTVVIDTEYKRSFDINSDWISDSQSAWLEELMTSPVVFREINATTMEAVNLSATTYEIKRSINERLVQLKVSFDNGFSYKRQRG
jgi:hypothetical protein